MLVPSPRRSARDLNFEIDTSPYLRHAPRILRDVCRTMGRDDHGRACATCSVRAFCEAQANRYDRLPDAA